MEVIQTKPTQLLELNWRYTGYKGNAIVTFKRTEMDKQTMLTLTHTVTEDFTESVSEFKRESCISGWRYYLQERLKKHLT
jgi:hypothetical protein